MCVNGMILRTLCWGNKRDAILPNAFVDGKSNDRVKDEDRSAHVILLQCVLKSLLGVLNGVEGRGGTGPPNELGTLTFVEVLRVASVAPNYWFANPFSALQAGDLLSSHPRA
jgi:hypothetical protein